MYHVPYSIVTTCYPMVLVDGFIAFDAYKVFSGSQLAVKIGSCNHYFFIFRESFGCFLYNRESGG